MSFITTSRVVMRSSSYLEWQLPHGTWLHLGMFESDRVLIHNDVRQSLIWWPPSTQWIICYSQHLLQLVVSKHAFVAQTKYKTTFMGLAEFSLWSKILTLPYFIHVERAMVTCSECFLHNCLFTSIMQISYNGYEYAWETEIKLDSDMSLNRHWKWFPKLVDILSIRRSS